MERRGSGEMVIALWIGPCLMEVTAYQGRDTRETTGHVKGCKDRFSLTHVVIDDAGIGGAVTDGLQEQGIEVTAFNSSRKAGDETKFVNAKAETYWALRKKLNSGVLDDGPPLIDLTRVKHLKNKILAQQGMVDYKLNSSGKTRSLSRMTARTISR